MTLSALQIVLLIIIFFALSRVLLRVRGKNISMKMGLFWTLLWVLAAVGVLLPATTSVVARAVGVGRGADIVIYVSLLLLFYLTFRIYVMIEDLRRDITSVVRQLAIKNPIKRKKRRRRR